MGHSTHGAMELNPMDFVFLGLCIEGLLYGLYSGIFIMFLQYHASKNQADNSILFYALCFLYMLCVAMISADIAASVVIRESSIIYRITIIQVTVFGCYDFLSQCILIYRCWIVWGCNTYVVIVPSILAIAFLATWAGGLSGVPDFNVEGRFVVTGPRNTLTISSLALSMSVNALVMCLIVFKIYKVFKEVKYTTTSDENSLGIANGTKLWSIMFVIIESGMALFSIQLARVAVSNSLGTTAGFDAFGLIVGIHEMLNGITPTIILVRVSIGLSFHDEGSMVEAVGSLLHFTPDGSESDRNSESIPETGSISQEGRDESDDCHGIGGSDDIQIMMAER